MYHMPSNLHWKHCTIRNLHDRVKEHATRPASSIYKHFAAHHKIDNINDSITVTIITKERDPVNLRLKEAYYIRKLRPEINSREERSELTELLYCFDIQGVPKKPKTIEITYC